MREIKFRLFDKRDKEMIYPKAEDIDMFNLCFCGDSWQVEFDNSEDDKKYYGKEVFEIMQFTGLLDKNGKEIYEGDIVADEEYGNGAIEWSTQYGGYVIRYVDGEFNHLFEDTKDTIEVIGDIYSNPELLANKD